MVHLSYNDNEVHLTKAIEMAAGHAVNSCIINNYLALNWNERNLHRHDDISNLTNEMKLQVNITIRRTSKYQNASHQ